MMGCSLELVVVAEFLEYWCCLGLVAVRDTGKRNLRRPFNGSCDQAERGWASVGFCARRSVGIHSGQHWVKFCWKLVRGNLKVASTGEVTSDWEAHAV